MSSEKANLRFEVALGEEDGNMFAAILWPEALGSVPFVEPISLGFAKEGVVLFNDPEGKTLYISGLDPSLLNELDERHVVILTRNGDDYGQFEVNKTNHPLAS